MTPEPLANPAQRGRRLRRRILIAAGIPLGLVAVLALSYSGSLVVSYQSNVTSVVVPEDLGVPGHARPAAAADGAQTILLLGSDSSDVPNTFLLLRITAARDAIVAMSLPSALVVTPPTGGPMALRDVEPLLGLTGVIGALEDFGGVRLDHFVALDLQAFADAADVLGGITVQNPTAFTSTVEHRTFPAGAVNLNGDAALEYVRETAALPGGEGQRMRNQQAFLAGATRAVLSAKTLTSPTTVADLVARVSPSLEVDSGLNAVTLIGLGWELRALDPAALTFASLPETAASGAGQQALRDALAADTLARYLTK